MAQAENRPHASDADVRAFLAAVEPPRRRAEGQRLLAIFAEMTGFPARLWGTGIVGFGRYDYRYASGRSGSFLATGFAPRRAECVIYILPGYADFGTILAGLGPHRKGKSCLYIRDLGRIDEAALRHLIRAGLDDLATRWPVLPF